MWITASTAERRDFIRAVYPVGFGHSTKQIASAWLQTFEIPKQLRKLKRVENASTAPGYKCENLGLEAAK